MFIVLERIHDPAGFDEYLNLVMPTLATFGGKFLVRGGRFTVVEGNWPHERVAIVEFPSRAEAEAWYASPAYQAILPLRLKSMTSSAVMVDAVD
ncbi:MAG: DUF1330 domain-containing protein [Proteobacteria bacterium]|nr:DUF1330 domain-containing protein [Pseudomonadota bacterium]MBS0572312.1 DUF1330 domain-containing protein [Pseudomonadota bacterium]